MQMSTTFKQFYVQFLSEDMTSMSTYGSNAQYYDNMGEPNGDNPQPNDMRIPIPLGANKKISRRTMPETVFLTGKVTKKPKNKKK